MKMMSTIAAIVICLGLATGAQAADSLKVKPFTFADTQGDFGPPVDPDVVSAKWVNKRGTTSTPTTNGASGDFGLVLTKNTATATFAASGAIVKGPEGDVVAATTEFDYAYRNDGHCGAGAPRFSVVVTDGMNQTRYAVGCANAATSTANVNASWTNKTWTPANFFLQGNVPSTATHAPVPMIGSTIVSAAIIFDEGTDVGPGCDRPLNGKLVNAAHAPAGVRSPLLPPHDAGHDADRDQEPTDADDDPGELPDHFRHGEAGSQEGKPTDGRRQISRDLRRWHEELDGAQDQEADPLRDRIDRLQQANNEVHGR